MGGTRKFEATHFVRRISANPLPLHLTLGVRRYACVRHPLLRTPAGPARPGHAPCSMLPPPGRRAHWLPRSERWGLGGGGVAVRVSVLSGSGWSVRWLLS